MASFNIEDAGETTWAKREFIRTCYEPYIWHDRWKHACSTFRMRIDIIYETVILCMLGWHIRMHYVMFC